MLGYYVALAWRNARRQPGYIVLIAAVLGVGMGTFMTMCSLLYVLNGDPIPSKSQHLLSVQLGRASEDAAASPRVTTQAVAALRKMAPEVAMVATTYGFAGVEADTGDRRQSELIRFAEPGFFRMFDVPLSLGREWTVEEETQGAPVAVIGQDLAMRLYPAGMVVGRSLIVGGARFRVIGVLGDWQPMPRFYDLSVGAYAPADQLFLPLSSVGAMDDGMFMARECTADQLEVTPRALHGSSCAWLNLWALTNDQAQRQHLETSLQSLLQVGQQQGWLRPGSRYRVENVRELLMRTGVIPGGIKFGALLAAGFLLLCLANASGLLLASCLRRTREIGIRRALGASRGDIMCQFMIESALVGALSSVTGLVLAEVGVTLSRQLPQAYMQLADLDIVMASVATGASLLGALAAGLFPAWRASQIQPAIQIKVD